MDGNFIVALNEYLIQYLMGIGFSPKLIGFEDIKLCVIYSITECNGKLLTLNTIVYPTIAKNRQTLAVNIERNIRNAINKATKGEAFNYGTGNVFKNIPNITNRAFLAFLVEKANTFKSNFSNSNI